MRDIGHNGRGRRPGFCHRNNLADRNSQRLVVRGAETQAIVLRRVRNDLCAGQARGGLRRGVDGCVCPLNAVGLADEAILSCRHESVSRRRVDRLYRRSCVDCDGVIARSGARRQHITAFTAYVERRVGRGGVLKDHARAIPGKTEARTEIDVAGRKRASGDRRQVAARPRRDRELQGRRGRGDDNGRIVQAAVSATTNTDGLTSAQVMRHGSRDGQRRRGLRDRRNGEVRSRRQRRVGVDDFNRELLAERALRHVRADGDLVRKFKRRGHSHDGFRSGVERGFRDVEIGRGDRVALFNHNIANSLALGPAANIRRVLFKRLAKVDSYVSSHCSLLRGDHCAVGLLLRRTDSPV